MRKLPKVVFTDIDGVWTDGGMYYDQTGNEWKKFNTRDSGGVLLLRKLNIPLVILTGENTDIVKFRAAKLKIANLYQGVENKLEIARKLCNEFDCDISETAFIGDDWIDIELLDSVGISSCPADAAIELLERVSFVCTKKGGEGVFREFVERVISISK